MRASRKREKLNDEELRRAYEKTALYRMGIPMEYAMERVSWLRDAIGYRRGHESARPSPLPIRQ